MNYDPPLDPGIEPYVEVLNSAGVETFESCEGGWTRLPSPNGAFSWGAAGWRTLSVALDCGLPIKEVRRTWPIIDGAPTAPWWEITLSRDTTCGGRLR